MKTILVLAANPKNTPYLRLDEEVREIEDVLKRAKQREHFTLTSRLAARPKDIQQAMVDIEPHIVHFSGHGTDEGLMFEDEIGKAQFVDQDALARLFYLFADRLECVVLNGCYSLVQAQAIVQHIPSVIGMTQSIQDKAAIKFAEGFYRGLGAGKNVEFAYNLGCNAIELEGIREQHLTPILLKQNVANPQTAH